VSRVAGWAGAAWVVAAFGFIFLPIGVLVLFSFQDGILPVPPLRGLSLRWYEALLADGRMQAALVNSVIVGLVSAGVATLLGFLAAYGLARHRPRAARIMRGLIMSPIAVSYLVIGLGLALGFNQLGLSRDLWQVAIGHVVINLPIAFAVIASQMSAGQEHMEQAARDLGASELRVLVGITAPILMPALLAAFVLTFTLSWDEFVIALLLTRFDVTLPVEIWSAIRTGLDPRTNALGTLVFALSLAVLLLSFPLFRWLSRRSAA
jgi:spermidine/putrescine transport system permease protein